MILGLGTDIVEIARIEQLVAEFGARFIERILTPQEQTAFGALPASRQIAWIAKRFAAKEACAKALGAGIGAISFQDITVLNNPNGAPIITLSGAARARFAAITPAKAKPKLDISLSDERSMALAVVIASWEL